MRMYLANQQKRLYFYPTVLPSINICMTTYRIYDTESEVEPLADSLWSVKNCFSADTLARLDQPFLNHEDSWHRHEYCLPYRMQLTADSPTLKLMQQMALDMLPAIEAITELRLKFMECKMWLDLSKWHCPYHRDHESIAVTYQTFLWSHGTVNGTEFLYGPTVADEDMWRHDLFKDHQRVTTEFVPNTGYINRNLDRKVHWTRNQIGTRLSAAWQFMLKV